jgi:hypothetical protein
MKFSLRAIIPLILLSLAFVGAAAPRSTPTAAARPARALPTQAGCTGDCKIMLPLISLPKIAPRLNEPLDQAHVDSIAPTLTWFPATQGTKYIVQVATSTDFISGTVEVSTTKTLSEGATDMQRNVPRSNLKESTTYFWRVGVYLPDGIHYAPTASFTTAVDDPQRRLATPDHLSPPAGAKIATTTPTLIWAAMPGADAYRLRIVLRSTGDTIRTTSVLDAPQTSYTVPAGVLAPLTTYRWQLRAHTSFGWSEYGSFWDIKIQ